MLSQPEPACLVIADITGYTSYLAGVELDHAQDILADLVDTVVRSLRPNFKLTKLEGDAAFTYAMTGTVDASALMDTVERTYFAFRRRLRDIGQASTCDCNACMRMPSLDLKLLAHHGTIMRQKIGGRMELVGSPVIVAHRLLKNAITEQTGFAAYALYTADCLTAAGVQNPAALGLVEHRETYEHLGEVVGWVADLDAAWRADLDSTRIIVEPDQAMATFEFDLPAPPAVAWDYLTSPARRLSWQAGATAIQESTTGRRGVGTTNHCVHGKEAVVEEVLDWRPPEYFTIRMQVPVPGAPKMRSTDVLTATPSGTHVEMRIERPRSPQERAFLEALLPQLEPSVLASFEALSPLLADEMTRRAAEDRADPEPVTPVSAGRFLATAVDSARIHSS